MSTQRAEFDWQVLLDDCEWGRTESFADLLDVRAQPATSARTARRGACWRYAATGIVSLFVLLAGVWAWSYASRGASRIDQEIQGVIGAESWGLAAAAPTAARSLVDRQADVGWQSGYARELDDGAARAVSPDGAAAVEVHDIALRPDRAMAAVTVAEADGTHYRELRFYRADAASGWLRTAPDAAFWGAPQTVETAHFRFAYRSRDAGAVLRAAPKLDAIYVALRQDVGLPPDDRKLTVVVSPVSIYQLPGLYFQDDRLIVHSPSLLQVPTDLTDEAVLTKAIVNPLVVHELGDAPLTMAPWHWRPVVNGLLLWEAYVGSDALAPWYREAVAWYYGDRRTLHQSRTAADATDLTLLCREYRIWRHALPTSLVEPWRCDNANWRAYLLAIGPAPRRLSELLVVEDWQSGGLWPSSGERMQAVGAATLIDYVVAAYGRDYLPALVAGFQVYDDWTDLAPAVFGVSAEELDAGWQTYLADLDGPPIPPLPIPDRADAASGVQTVESFR